MTVSWGQGDVIAVGFDPSQGHEPRKTRPAVVISCDRFNVLSSLTVVVPVTSTDNGYPLHLPVCTRLGLVHGFACIEQVRALDLAARDAHKIDELDDDALEGMLEAVGAVFDI